MLLALEDKLYPYLKYYQKMPPSLMKGFGKLYSKIPLSIRYGKVFKEYYLLLAESQHWDDVKKENYIKKKLIETLNNAYHNTKYYKKAFDLLKIDPKTFGNLETFKSIPFTDKEILRNNRKDIISQIYNKKNLVYTTTGGSSGVPVGVFLVKGVERSRELAFMIRQWERVGYKFDDRLVVLRGGVVNDKTGNLLYKYEPVKNRLLLSNFDLNEDNIKKYIDKIIDFKPKFVHTYPSAISIIAKYLIKNKIFINGIKGILCSSEQIYPGQREIIENAFNAKVYSWYGHTEAGTLAGECEYSNDYHIFFEYGYTELVDEDGNVINEAGVRGEIVSTSFEMKGFPIIRYRTGDYAEYSGDKCKCGRNYTLLRNIQGRWTQEFIITKNNLKISLTALNMHTNIFDNVFQYQFHQKEKGKLKLKVIPNNQYSKKDSEKIVNEFNEKFRDNIDLEVEIVDKIEKTGMGKHKFLIQEINE